MIKNYPKVNNYDTYKEVEKYLVNNKYPPKIENKNKATTRIN
jgi:hypothetical protein